KTFAMNRYWKLREEFYRVFHRWPSMVALFFVGCAFGWAISFLWPTYYRATAQIFVGLNPYRTFEDATFMALTAPQYRNIDNYHHWQMSQLEMFIYLSDVIQDTLAELCQADPYWETITASQLREMLSVEWRSAGKWELIAEHHDAEHARQAAEAWSIAARKHVNQAVASARDTFMIDQELQEVASEKLEASARRRDLYAAKYALLAWQEASKGLPPDQPIDPAEQWRVLFLTTRPAQYTPFWITVLDEQPAPDAPLQVYTEWVIQILPVIDDELASLDQRIDTLEQQHAELSEQYSLASANSSGLSPSIEIEGVETIEPQIVRPTSSFPLIGGVLGLLIWGFIQLVIITTRE
ncbi:MAG: hypothetical protein JXA78_01125, partial [Anaerolineales bacterium]|nr:hypothetical protein [Anaerolineales bacterium]